MDKSAQLEAVLFYKNEPVTMTELGKLVGLGVGEVEEQMRRLQDIYKERGIVLVTDGEYVSFGTNPALSELIEVIQKEELSRDIGRAGLETLAIILYRGPVSRREIDNIRGVNSGYILRNLLVRGLIDREEADGRSFSYKPTLKLMEYLGVSRKEDLPQFETAYANLEQFVKSEREEETNTTENNE